MDNLLEENNWKPLQPNWDTWYTDIGVSHSIWINSSIEEKEKIWILYKNYRLDKLTNILEEKLKEPTYKEIYDFITKLFEDEPEKMNTLFTADMKLYNHRMCSSYLTDLEELGKDKIRQKIQEFIEKQSLNGTPGLNYIIKKKYNLL